MLKLNIKSCAPRLWIFQFWRDGNFIIDRKLFQCFILEAPADALFAQFSVFGLHRFHISPFLNSNAMKKMLISNQNVQNVSNSKISKTYVWFFRFEVILLFNALDSTTGRIASVLQCTTPLFHTNDFRTS